jgi:Tfp pilus assembly protein FimT
MLKPLNRAQGVTFLEIIVVVGIIGLLAVVFRPSAKAFLDRIRLWNAANAIKQELILAKTRALADPNMHAGIFFDTSKFPHKIQTFVDDDSTALNDNLYSEGKDRLLAPSYVLSITDTLKLISGSNVVIFRGDGSAKASTTITISGKAGKRDTITVLASTGRIRIGKNF